MATLHSESSKELMRSSHDGRPLLLLIRGNGLRSRWQSRQSDCAERRRRSSEFKGALHSSQRGGPTRPLWSCAIEIPPSRTQTGEQMKQQSCVVKQAWFYAALFTVCLDALWEPHHSAVEWRTTGSQRSAPDGRVFPPKQWIAPQVECPEWGSRRRRLRCAGLGKVAGRWFKPAPLPAMQSQLPLCI